MKDFCDKLFTAFEKQITDNIFCFIQNDKELMKDYLDLVAKQGNLGVVNSQIAQKIAQRYGMNNTGKESVPNSNLCKLQIKNHHFFVINFHHFFSCRSGGCGLAPVASPPSYRLQPSGFWSKISLRFSIL